MSENVKSTNFRKKNYRQQIGLSMAYQPRSVTRAFAGPWGSDAIEGEYVKQGEKDKGSSQFLGVKLVEKKTLIL